MYTAACADDALCLAHQRQVRDPSKAKFLPFPYDPRALDLEFFLLSSRNAFCCIRTDTAGQLTYIIGITGCKTWYIPESFDVTQTLQVREDHETRGSRGA